MIAARCSACWRERTRCTCAHCDCGRVISRGATMCKPCFIARERQRGQLQRTRRRVHRCIGCGCEFQRVRKPRDACKYCKRACAFAHWSEIRSNDPRMVRARARPPKTLHCRDCGALRSPRCHRCDVCREVRAWEQAEIARQQTRQQQRAHRQSRSAWPFARRQHVCPVCGEPFTSDTRHRVFCSPDCGNRAHKAMDRMRLSLIPPAERAQLSAMLAEMHAAYREIDRFNKGNV